MDYIFKKIDSLPIRLGQLLKLLELVDDGIQAKQRIGNGGVMVNGTVCTQRGKKITSSDIITFQGVQYRIVSE